MNALTPFTYGDNVVRIMEVDGEPWFVAADVCKVLDIRNVTQAVELLDADERYTLSNTEGVPGANGAQSFNLISEPGLYALVMRSRKPEARKFDRWVRHEVLPSIRRTGSYMAPQMQDGDEDELDQFGPLAALSVKLRMVSLASRLHGTGAARRMWVELGLPAIEADGAAPLSDIVLGAINRAGIISQPELYRAVKKHKMTSTRLWHVVDALAADQRIRVERIATGGAGRPRTVYHAVDL
jgi:prophage antirepressor-like protein